MKLDSRVAPLVASLLISTAASAGAAPVPRSAPEPVPAVSNIPAARDVAFPGTIDLKIDATDVQRRVFRVTETVPVPAGQTDLILLLPEWLPGRARQGRDDEPARRRAFPGQRAGAYLDPRPHRDLRLPRGRARGRHAGHREVCPNLPAAEQRGAHHDDHRHAQPAVGQDEPLSGGLFRASDPVRAHGHRARGLAGLHRPRRPAARRRHAYVAQGRLRAAGRFTDPGRPLRAPVRHWA